MEQKPFRLGPGFWLLSLPIAFAGFRLYRAIASGSGAGETVWLVSIVVAWIYIGVSSYRKYSRTRSDIESRIVPADTPNPTGFPSPNSPIVKRPALVFGIFNFVIVAAILNPSSRGLPVWPTLMAGMCVNALLYALRRWAMGRAGSGNG